MSKLTRRLLPLWIAATLGLNACAGAPLAPGATAAIASVTLQNPWYSARRVQYVAAPAHLRVRISNPGGTPFEAVVDAGAAQLSFNAIPMGDWRILTVEGLDADKAAIPGSVSRVAAHLQPGPNTLTVDPLTTAAAAVVEALLELDQTHGTHQLAGFTPAGIEAALRGYVKASGAASPALLDTAAIARAAYDAGAMPAAMADAVAAPGRVIVVRENWPAGVELKAVLNDPVSWPATINPDEDLVFDHVPAGTWTLQVSPAGAGGRTLAPLPVTVTAGETTRVTVPFGAASTRLPSLPTGVSAPIAGVLGAGPEETFYLWGGALDAGSFYDALFSYRSGAADWDERALSYWSPQLAASVVHGGAIYSFGGVEYDDEETYLSGAVYRFEPGMTDPAYIGDLPEGAALVGGTAGAIGETLYLAGGQWADDDGFGLREHLLAYTPGTDAWEAVPVPAPAPGEAWVALASIASAVVDGRWYLFGGQTGEYAPPAGQVSVFDPADRTWRRLPPMPTPRAGAAALAVDGKIWVIGGIIDGNEPSDAVEVFDPVSNAWESRPRLRYERFQPAVGLLGGKIVVAGGLLGSNPVNTTPTPVVEEITP